MRRLIHLLIIVFILILLGCGKEERIKIDRSKPIVVLGDSITEGYGVGRSYTEYLTDNLGIEVMNFGQNGDTTAGGLRRIDEVLKIDSDIVVVELGGNDFLGRVDPERVEENLSKITEKLLDNNRIVFLVKFYPEKSALMFFIRGNRKVYDEMYRRLAVDENVYIVDNIWKDVWGKEMLDTIHPNQRGHEKMAENIEESLRKIIEF